MKSLLNIALAFATTIGVVMSDSGTQLYEKAEHGNQIAQVKLGLLMASSDDSQKVRAGLEWLARAANGGNILAMYNLGAIYQDGKIAKKDVNKAILHLTVASELGEVRAMNRLAGIYFRGDGVQKDRVVALKWALIASASGDATAKENLSAIEDELPTREKALGAEAARNWVKVRSGDISNWENELSSER